jgi:chromate transporter
MAAAPTGLRDLAAIFLRLGLTAFGGPAAHIGLMRDEFVRRRGWLDDAAYLDLIGAANLIPGPTSTEVAMHVGHRRAGWAGLIVAGLAFLLPAVVIVAILAAIYVEAGTRPAVEAIFIGVGPVVVAIIASAGVGLGRSALRTPVAVTVAIVAAGGALFRVPEVGLLLGLGLATLLVGEVRRRAVGLEAVALLMTPWRSAPGSSIGDVLVGTAMAAAATPPAIFAEFLKIGAVLFGSGYVLVALLRSELVVSLGWITDRELIDAIAVGQATPGPLFSSATFIGYLVGGPVGAAAATIGIFLPAFLAVALSIPLLERMRASVRTRDFLDGVNGAALGLLAVVAAQLAIGVLVDPLAVLLAIVALVALVRGVPAPWLIGAGAALGVARLIADGA